MVLDMNFFESGGGQAPTSVNIEAPCRQGAVIVTPPCVRQLPVLPSFRLRKYVPSFDLFWPLAALQVTKSGCCSR